MRTKIYLPALVCLALILFLGCQKTDQRAVKAESPAATFSVLDAKAWYGTLPKGGMVNGRTSATSKIKKFEPDWSTAKSSEDESYYIVESSLNFDKTPAFPFMLPLQRLTLPI
jgi:hypothetical protein